MAVPCMQGSVEGGCPPGLLLDGTRFIDHRELRLRRCTEAAGAYHLSIRRADEEEDRKSDSGFM